MEYKWKNNGRKMEESEIWTSSVTALHSTSPIGKCHRFILCNALSKRGDASEDGHWAGFGLGHRPGPSSQNQGHPDRYNVPLDVSQFTDLVKLRGSESHHDWHHSIHTAFQNQGVWALQLDKSLSALLGLTVDRAILADMPENISIDAMYDFLQTKCQPKPKPQFPQLLKTLTRLRLDNFASVSDYAHKFMPVESEMESMQPNGISQTVVNTIFLEGLGRK
ncbi:unnamed protein product [Penicillium pancosmium]